MTDFALEIDRKLARAQAAVDSSRLELRAAADKSDVTPFNISSLANTIAETEGARDFWLRMQQVATYQHSNLTMDHLNSVAMDMLTQGADDSWSGRGNDIKRARFDGIRSAATNLRYL